jgi:hypothetical protein
MKIHNFIALVFLGHGLLVAGQSSQPKTKDTVCPLLSMCRNAMNITHEWGCRTCHCSQTLLRKRHVQDTRDLIFLGKSGLKITRPTNGAVVSVDKGTKFTVEVDCGGPSFLGFLKTFSKVELVMDKKVIGKRTKFLGMNGKIAFTVDAKGMTLGSHKLQARGSHLLGRSVLSEEISITIGTPTLAPTSAPKFVPPAECNPADTFLYFTGHDHATSYMKGAVNLTWSPAFAYHIEQERLLWCGDVTYEVYYGQGEIDFTQGNTTGSDLAKFAQASGMSRMETTKLNAIISDLDVGTSYSFLVTAKTAIGHLSFNREAALVTVAKTSPVINSAFTRLVNVPLPTAKFQVFNDKDAKIVKFSGEKPNEVLDLQSMDFVYFIDSNGNATMVQILSKVQTGGSDMVAWSYQEKGLGEIFDELDLSSEHNKAYQVGELEEANVGAIDVFDPSALAALHKNVIRDLCILAYPGSDGNCNPNAIGRRLGECGFFCQIWRGIENAAKAVAKAIKDATDAVEKEFAKERTLEKSATFLDISQAAILSSQSKAIEVGVKFDASAKARMTLTFSLKSAVHRAAMGVFGGFGVKGYISLDKSQSTVYQPPALELFSSRFGTDVWIGPIWVKITHRPKVSAYVALSASVEGKAVASAQYGYDYSFDFTYDKNRAVPFQQKSSFIKRNPFPSDPVFNLRCRAEAEVGVTFQWDVLLYELLQATIGLDLALKSALEVGTSVDAIVVTPPYFFTLDEFTIDLIIRVRLLLGINNDIVKVIRQIVNGIVDPLLSFKPSKSFVIPVVQQGVNQLPDSIKTAVDKAKQNPALADATSLALNQVDDTYTRAINTIKGLDFGFGLNVVIYSDKIFLLGTPRITLNAAPEGVQVCKGNDLMSIRVTTSLVKAALPFRNGLARGQWFPNLDGKLFKEDTPWIMSTDRTDFNSISLRLPKSVVNKDGVYLQDGASVYLRATPEILPLPFSMYAKGNLKSLFPRIPQPNCCSNEDCERLFDVTYRCDGSVCTKSGIPK